MPLFAPLFAFLIVPSSYKRGWAVGWGVRALEVGAGVTGIGVGEGVLLITTLSSTSLSSIDSLGFTTEGAGLGSRSRNSWLSMALAY